MTDDLGQAAGDGPETDEIDRPGARRRRTGARRDRDGDRIVPVERRRRLAARPRSTGSGDLLERSDLTELEVEAGGTRARPAQARRARRAARRSARRDRRQPPAPRSRRRRRPSHAAGGGPPAPSRPSVKAPLTGIWYGSPAPGSAPFVEVGREVAVGQVIGLIEAMKLFNEIKSDLAGRRRPGRPGERRAGQGEAAADRGGTPVNDATAPTVAPMSPAGGATRRPRS